MICVNCESPVDLDAKFCDKCGAALADDRTRRPNLPRKVPTAGPIHSTPSVVVIRNPGLALLLSIFFPGAGQIYNGEIGKGIGMFVGYFACWLLVSLVVPIFGAIAIWLWSVIDAYQKAKASAA